MNGKRLLVVVLIICACIASGRASENLLHAVANHGQAPKAAISSRSRPDWRLYHKTDELLLRIRALAAHCPHAHAQNILLDHDDQEVDAQLHDIREKRDASWKSRRSTLSWSREREAQALKYASVKLFDAGKHANIHREAMDLDHAARNSDVSKHSVLVVTLAANAARRKYLEYTEGQNDRLRKRRFSFGYSYNGAKSTSVYLKKWPDMPEDAKKRLRILAAFGEHGREFISAEVALRLVERICAPVGPDVDENLRAQLLRELRRTEIILVPIVNEASRRLAESGRLCERLNARGVDINRNFGHSWGLSDKTTVPEEERPGHAPFSEFESRAIHVLARHVQPHAYISFHSGGHAVVMPWDSTGELPSSSMVQKDLKYVADVIHGTHCPVCQVGTAEKIFGYRAFGTGVDFMHGIMHVPIALTLEVYGDESAGHEDCFRFFNPASVDGYKDAINNWAHAFETMSVAMHSLKSVQIHLNSSSSALSSSGRSDGWAFVASRLGHSGWTTTAYRASISTDVFPPSTGQDGAAKRHGSPDALLGSYASGLLRRKSRDNTPVHAHPAVSFISALFALAGLVGMLLVAKVTVTKRRGRTSHVARPFSPNAPPANGRRFRHSRAPSALLPSFTSAAAASAALPNKRA